MRVRTLYSVYTINMQGSCIIKHRNILMHICSYCASIKLNTHNHNPNTKSTHTHNWVALSLNVCSCAGHVVYAYDARMHAVRTRHVMTTPNQQHVNPVVCRVVFVFLYQTMFNSDIRPTQHKSIIHHLCPLIAWTADGRWHQKRMNRTASTGIQPYHHNIITGPVILTCRGLIVDARSTSPVR